jgi:hypothetical protein
MGLVEVKNEIEVSNNANEIARYMQEYETTDIVLLCERMFQLKDIEALNLLFKSNISSFKKRSHDPLFRAGYNIGYFTAAGEICFHEGPIYEFHYNDDIDDFQYRNGWYLGFGKYIFKTYKVQNEDELHTLYNFYLARIANEIITSTEFELQSPEIRNVKIKEKILNKIKKA